MESVLKEVLIRISPTQEERTKVDAVVQEFIKKNPGLDVFIGGSYAKGTWLSGITDIDLFVRFPACKKGISEALLKKLNFPVNRIHGSRDYFDAEYKGIRFELVPICKIQKSDQARIITDISPLHVAWVKKKSE